MPAPKTLVAAVAAGALLVPMSAPVPAQADVVISYSSGYGKLPTYKRGFGYGHNPPYAVKRPRIYGYSPYRTHRYGGHRYGRYYSYGYTAPWVFKRPYYGQHGYDYRPPIERKTRPGRSDRIIWNPAPGGRNTVQPRQYCTLFEDRVRIDGRWQEVTGRACQQPDGTWKIVSK